MSEKETTLQLNEIEMPLEYLEDEVRDGFYIPAIMKQFWAAELETLKELDRICSKHGLKYYADWGSLLGAVRHGGFIPWDDDLDVLMVREDYMALLKLQEEHPEEFPEGFGVRSFRNREDYFEFHGVFVGSERTSFEPEHLKKFHGFPYIPAIDIFVLDHKSTDPEKQATMAKQALFLIALADEIGEGKLNFESKKANIEKIKSFVGIKNVPTNLNISDTKLRIALYDCAESMFAAFKDENSDMLIQNIPWGLLHPENGTPKEYYKYQVKLPFEFMTIPVPGEYDTMLKRKYGDYLQIKKGVGAHEYPCFAEQERNLKSVLDFELPEFHFSNERLSELRGQRMEFKANSYNAIASDCINQMKLLFEEIISFCFEDYHALEINLEVFQQNLADLQQLCLDLGEFTDSVKGEGTNLVSNLEKLCEQIFNLYNEPDNGDFAVEFANCFNEMLAEEEKELSRKSVVFIPFKQEGFEKLLPLIRKTMQEENCDVTIIDAPYFYKAFDGQIIAEITTEYSENLNIVDYRNINFESLHPDVIFAQFPYDSWNPVMTVPRELFAENLVPVTEKFVYVPWFTTFDFTKEDVPDYVNTKYYITMPGVAYADEVLVDSEKIRAVYTERLTEFSDSSYKEYWESVVGIYNIDAYLNNSDKKNVQNGSDDEGKIQTSEKNDIPSKPGKNMFYYVGLCAFLQNPDVIIEKVRRNIEIFKENSERINVKMYIDPAIEYNLPDINPDIWKDFSNLLDEITCLDFVEQADDENLDATIKKCDAYYGDSGRLVRRFVDAKKPVMIQNPEV